MLQRHKEILMLLFVLGAATHSGLLLAAETYFKPAQQTTADVVVPRESYSATMVMRDGSLLAQLSATINGHAEAGSLLVFERDAEGRWNFHQRIDNPDPQPLDSFGRPKLDGDTALVTAFGKTVDGVQFRGAGYLYERDLETRLWSLKQTLIRIDGEFGDFFGVGVALEGGTAILGAMNADSPGAPNAHSGVAYVYKQDVNGDFQEAGSVYKPELVDAKFGNEITLDGNIAVIVAPDEKLADGMRVGPAYVFRRDAATGEWIEEARLTADGTGPEAFLGLLGQDALQGDRLLVPAMTAVVDGVEFAGKLYFFRNDPDLGWIKEDILMSPEPTRGTRFGSPHAWQGDRLLAREGALAVGADDGSPGIGGQSGYFRYYREDTGTGDWQHQQVITLPVAGARHVMGTVAWDGGSQAIFGASEWIAGLGGNVADKGGVLYVFEQVTGPAINFDVGMTVDVAEVETGEPATFTVEVANADDTTTATNVRLVNPLLILGADGPQIATLVSASSNCSVVGNDLECTLGDLAPGAVTTVEMTLSFDAPDNKLLNVASVEADQPSRDMRRNHAVHRLHVSPPPAPPPQGGGSSGGGAMAWLLLLLLCGLRWWIGKPSRSL